MANLIKSSDRGCSMRKIENIIKLSVGLVCIASIVAIVSNFI